MLPIWHMWHEIRVAADLREAQILYLAADFEEGIAIRAKRVRQILKKI